MEQVVYPLASVDGIKPEGLDADAQQIIVERVDVLKVRVRQLKALRPSPTH